MCMHVVRIESDSPREVGFSLYAFIEVDEFTAFQKIVIGTPVRRRFPSDEFGTMSSDASFQCHSDRGGYVCLNRKDIRDWSVVSFCPKMTCGFSVDKLRGNSDARSELPNAPFDDIADAKLASHDLDFRRRPVKLE